MAAKMNGSWKLQHSENFDDYMKALGIGFPMRKMGNLAKPVLTIEIKGTAVSMKTVSTFRNIDTKCVIDEEWDEETTDGRKCKSVMKWDGDKLVQSQKWGGDKETVMTRFVDSDGLLQMELVIGSIVAKRVYERSA